MVHYNRLEQLLHRLALHVRPVAELSFDIDQRMVESNPADVVGRRHVFIAGLARSGTTALMRRFHASGAFRSLTYRDMPFVLAPNLWRRLARRWQRETVSAERAHGDGVLVDFDSPESLDEVFWRVFTGESYIHRRHLAPHMPDQQTLWRYVCYVDAILQAQDGHVRRYLSKNNNNILRLAGIRQAFPEALLLVPFREPLSHAASLLRQHRNFSAKQAQDPFVGSYMQWLGHHEFGLDHRPFLFGGQATSGAPSDSSSVAYWLRLWCDTYEWLERSAPANAIFVCYEDLCRDPAVWQRLAQTADVADFCERDAAFRLSAANSHTGEDTVLSARAAAIYGRLVNRARLSLSATCGAQHESALPD